MVKGVSIKLSSYEETIPRLLRLIKLDNELKRHQHIVIKPFIASEPAASTPVAFVEQVLAFCAAHKSPESQISIAEGADSIDTSRLFEEQGYRALAEKYKVGLVDLNYTECEAIGKNEFAGFEHIMYPSLLKDAFIIVLPPVRVENGQYHGALTSMVGAFPARYYKGIFSRRKSKLDAYPFKYQVHDIILCKMPSLTLLELRDKGLLLAGNPLEMDKQAARLLGADGNGSSYLRMIDETLASIAEKKAEDAVEPATR